jgi:hypothetical protein
MLWDDLLSHLTRGLGAIAIIGATFWKGDDLVSEDGRKLISARLDAAISSPDANISRQVAAVARAYFSRRMPALAFIRNVLIFTIAAFLLLLTIYISLIPGFFGQLVSDADARWRFLGRLLGNGFVVTFVTNYIGFSVYAVRVDQADFRAARSLFVDIIVKVAAFIAITAVTYVVYANVYGSFSGSTHLALRAVGPTIIDAIWFRDLTSVYLYSVAISSLPLYLSFLVELMAYSPPFSRFVQLAFFWLPFRDKPIRTLALIFGTFFAVFASATAILVTAATRLIS